MEPFELAIDGEMIQTQWPFNTMESMHRLIEKGAFEPTKKKTPTMKDALYLSACYAGTATGQGLGRRLKENHRRIASSMKSGKLKGIKDLFTAGCPECDTAGVPIPGHEGSRLPFLYCGKCKENFMVVSIHHGKPCFSVGAGPSLTRNGKELRRVMGKYPIFACDAAVKPLDSMGVIPDYVLTLEWDPLTKDFFTGIDTSKMTLLTVTGGCPEVRNNWKGPVYVFATPALDPRTKRDHKKYFGDPGSALPGGNVTASILSMTTGLGVSPVIFVGHDFSYDHISGYFADGAAGSCVPFKKSFKTHDINGKSVLVDQTLYGYKGWHEGIIDVFYKDKTMTFINATEGGILGASYYDPDKLIRTKRLIRRLQYKASKLWTERRWPDTQEAEENGFRGKNLEAMEYMTLAEAIDKHCPDALAFPKERKVT